MKGFQEMYLIEKCRPQSSKQFITSNCIYILIGNLMNHLQHCLTSAFWLIIYTDILVKYWGTAVLLKIYFPNNILKHLSALICHITINNFMVLWKIEQKVILMTWQAYCTPLLWKGIPFKPDKSIVTFIAICKIIRIKLDHLEKQVWGWLCEINPSHAGSKPISCRILIEISSASS